MRVTRWDSAQFGKIHEHQRLSHSHGYVMTPRGSSSPLPSAVGVSERDGLESYQSITVHLERLPKRQVHSGFHNRTHLIWCAGKYPVLTKCNHGCA